MTTAQSDQDKKKEFSPEDYRMTIGEHLEELRHRLILGLGGLVIGVIVCLIFGERVIVIFCAPLIKAMRDLDINPQVYYTQVSDAFMTYLKVSLLCALALAGPWIIYQLWLFVAAGLYPKERKAVTKYIPLSMVLLTAGMLFVYFFVLPMTVRILIQFGSGIPLPSAGSHVTTAPATQASKLTMLDGDPKDLKRPDDEGRWWLNTHENRLKIYFKGKIRVVPFGPENLAAPMITLGDYIDLVVMTMIMFGVSFQLPLVILAVARIGIVDIATLKKYRRIVYFVMSILAAVIAPGDVVTAMLALLIPLILLYEMGILMAIWSERKAAREVQQEGQTD